MNGQYGKSHIHALPLYVPRPHGPRVTSLHGANENALGPSPKAISAMRDAAAFVHRYPDAQSLALREALAQRLGVDAEAISLTNGSDEMIALLCQALVTHGESVMVAAGSFITFAVRAAATGASVLSIPLHDYRHDLSAMVAAVAPETRLVFVCNPNNPTGTANTSKELARFLQAVPESVVVVVDEAYGDFVAPNADFPDSILELKSGRRNLVVLRTFAKSYGLAGLRIGYAIGDPALLAYVQKLKPIFSVNVMAQVAALAALNDDEHLKASVRYAQHWRSVFVERLGKAGLEVIASQANFIMVKLGDEIAAADYLADRGFSTTPLTAWGLPSYVRLSFGTPNENERLLSALESWAVRVPATSLESTRTRMKRVGL